MQDETINIANEQEAAVGILFACILHHNPSLSEGQIEHVSRMLVLSSKFAGHSLHELTVKALKLQSVHGSKLLIERSAPHITENFRETLFAMACEMITFKGNIAEDESEIIAMTALYLGLSIEVMKMMLTTYLIRNRWNVQVI
ncbi:MAG TPA: hypothetical protein VHK69_02445 [Chitinophagaceae bacterium]|jgi:hypothetical protein|nr:hypothetical protein [Chitinophagaceae bacterium]